MRRKQYTYPGTAIKFSAPHLGCTLAPPVTKIDPRISAPSHAPGNTWLSFTPEWCSNVAVMLTA